MLGVAVRPLREASKYSGPPAQIRKIITTFRDKLYSEIFPGRTEVPKTLIFAKDDNHAENIVEILREEFGKGNEFAQKITYRTTGATPKQLISAFRNSYHPRVAVTVDMIATGTDIKPVEIVFFIHQDNELVPFPERVNANFKAWLATQQTLAVVPPFEKWGIGGISQPSAAPRFTPEQMKWLEMIRDHIAANLGIGPDDFEYAPFSQEGGLGKVHQLFGDKLPEMLASLNDALAA